MPADGLLLPVGEGGAVLGRGVEVDEESAGVVEGAGGHFSSAVPDDLGQGGVGGRVGRTDDIPAKPLGKAVELQSPLLKPLVCRRS